MRPTVVLLWLSMTISILLWQWSCAEPSPPRPSQESPRTVAEGGNKEVSDADAAELVRDRFSAPDNSPDQPPSSRGQWKDCPSPPGGPRQENAVVNVNGKAWILGGFQGRSESDTVEIYDPDSGRWSKGPTLPVPMHHLNVAVVKGQVFVLGFLKSFRFEADGRGWRWDGSQWRALAAMPRARARGASGVGVIGGKIYVAGGLRKGQAVLDFSVYDPATNQWSNLPNLPSPIDHLAYGVIGKTFFLAGGRRARIASHQNSLYAYDSAQGTWSTRAPMPTSRAGVASTVHRGKLVVFGGEGNRANPDGVFGQVEVYDPALDRWNSLTPMPTPRHGTAAASLGEGIFVPVGADKQAFGAIDLCRIFVP